MNSVRRKRYLDALDIPQWQRRGQGVVSEAGELATVIPEPVPAPAMNVINSHAAAVAAMDWNALAQTVKDCRLCALRPGCTQTVFGVGSLKAPLLVVGEGPGADEDRIGEPFVGRAGKLLDSMLLAIGRQRSATTAAQAVFIANVVKCRPPNNRDPQPEEAAACRAYLERQIDLIKPRLILAVGRIAAQNLLQTDAPIGKLRGQLSHYGNAEKTPVIVTYHPAYLLRSPREKARAWDDLKKARALLRQISP